MIMISDINIPSLATLKKYGIGYLEFSMMWNRQGGVCAICKRLPKSGKLCIDHEHVKGFKKFPLEKKRKFVRGLICYQCNRFVVGRWGTLPKLQNAVEYLESYEARKAKAL